jgi:hypothetical protein
MRTNDVALCFHARKYLRCVHHLILHISLIAKGVTFFWSSRQFLAVQSHCVLSRWSKLLYERKRSDFSYDQRTNYEWDEVHSIFTRIIWHHVPFSMIALFLSHTLTFAHFAHGILLVTRYLRFKYDRNVRISIFAENLTPHSTWIGSSTPYQMLTVKAIASTMAWAACPIL